MRIARSLMCVSLVLVGIGRAEAQQSPSTNLNPRFERLLSNEPTRINEIRDGFLFLQQKNIDAQGHLRRGTHAKGICASAEFEVSPLTDLDPQIAARLRQGAFSQAGTYPAQVRFANADGKIQADQAPDVRAASFSVQMPIALAGPQGHLDFAMNDSSTFPINDAVVFANLMTIVKYGPAQGFYEITKTGLKEGNPLAPFRALAAASEAKKLGELQKKPLRESYQRLRYWSTVPFALGDQEAVKYSLKPCANNSAQALTADPDTLSKELKRHLSEDTPACFDFQVQLLEAGRMKDAQGKKHPPQDWIENATMDWPEAQAPFYTVARLTLKALPTISEAECESWRIDVTAHSNPTHRGLGSINRARASAERASAEARLR